MFWALLNPKGTKTTGNNSLFSPRHTSTFYFRYWTDFQLIFSNTRLRLCRDVLENDSRIEVPKNPRAALLAEKFISDRVKRVETKHYIYEGQVDEDGKPHGQVSMVFLLRPVATSIYTVIYVGMCALMSRASSFAPLADPIPRVRRKQLPPLDHNRRILSVAASNFSPRRKKATSHLNMSNGRSGSSHEARSRGNTDNKIHIHERAKPQSGIFNMSGLALINANMDAAGRA
jgi:hypothetical protein